MMDMFSMDFSAATLVLLFVTSLFAGFVDSIAGGGGLISLPVLLFAGVPVQMALGTNKLQSSFGALSAAYNYVNRGSIAFKGNLNGICFTLMGAATGAWTIQQMDADFLKHLVPVMLLLVFFYTLFSPDLGKTDTRSKMPRYLFFMVFGLGLGFYDGFFGPGTGSFWTGALMVFSGMNMTRAVGTTKIMNFTSNVVALFIFILGNNVVYTIGFLMAAGQIIGARIGSNLAIEKGTAFIRPIFLTVVFITIVRLVMVNYTG